METKHNHRQNRELELKIIKVLIEEYEHQYDVLCTYREIGRRESLPNMTVPESGTKFKPNGN